MSARRRLLALCLAPLLLLSGCGPLDEQRREVEQLRVMEVLGLDAAPGGLRLSLSGPPLGDEQAVFLASCTGASLSDAMERLGRRRATEELFYGHMQQLLLGEEAARQGIEPLLTAVCRSSDLRPDLPLYLVLGGTAEDAMAAAGQDGKGIGDILRTEEEAAVSSRLSSARGVLLDLDRQGCALVRALRLQEPVQSGAEDSAEDSEGETPPAALLPAGFGILVGDALRAQVPPEEAAAVALLTGELRPCVLVLKAADQSTVTYELEDGSLALVPGWDGNGALVSLELRLRARAVVLETDSFRPLSDDWLTTQLEGELARQVGSLLQRSRELEADFLGLGRRIEQQEPSRGRDLDLGKLLPGLALQVSVQGELSHSHDLRQEDSHGTT